MDNEKLDEKIVAEIRRHGALCKPDFPDCGLAYAIRQIIDEGRRPEPPRREAEQRVIEAALYRKLARQWRERLAICTPPDFIVEDDARKRELSMIRADIAYFDAQAAALTPAKGKEKCNRAVDPGNHEDCTACLPPKASKEK
jgi:hypothetical protein